MADERCRITVVGERRSVDLAVPAHAPIAEYVPMLVDLCGRPDSDAMPAAWSLARAGDAPFRPERSLDAAGVLDGDTLYLRDVLAGELDGPVVADLAEQVADLDDGIEWNPRTRAHVTLGLGLAVALAGAGALGAGADGAPLAGPLLFAAAVASAALAWVAGAKSWPVPPRLRLALAGAAAPLLAFAALTLPLPDGAAPAAVALAASIGAFWAYVAVPAVATLVLQLACALVTVPAVALTALRADGTEAAAVVAVAVFFLLGALPRIAAQVATVPPVPEPADDVEATVRRIQRLLIGLNAACCLVVAACLAVLSASGDWYALGLALCLSVALLCRAGSARLRAVVAATLTAAAAGLTALALLAAGDLFGPGGRLAVADVPGWTAPLATLGVGAAVVWWGLVLCFRSALQSAGITDRWSWPGALAGFLGAVSVPLAVGVFGVFGTLLQAGGKV